MENEEKVIVEEAESVQEEVSEETESSEEVPQVDSEVTGTDPAFIEVDESTISSTESGNSAQA